MNNFFNPDNAFFSFMGKAFDLIVLNFLWLLLYVPFFIFASLYATTEIFVFEVLMLLSLVVIVPSLSAMYYAVVKSVRRQRGYAIKEFVNAFKSNFRQGAIGSVIIVFFAWILTIDFKWVFELMSAETEAGTDTSESLIYLAIFVIIAFFVTGWFIYYFPVISRFTMKTFGAIKFSLGISAKHFSVTCLNVLIWAISAILVYITNFFAIIFIVSLAVLLESLTLEKILKKYTLKILEEKKENVYNGGTEGTENENTENLRNTEKNNRSESKVDEWYLE